MKFTAMKKFVSIMVIMLIASISFMAQNVHTVNPRQDSINTLQTSVPGDSIDLNTAEVCTDDESIASVLISEMSSNLIPAMGIIAVFGMPVFIILIVFIFQHKKQKAEYELAAKALEAGKDIPEGLFSTKKSEEKNTLTKGITNLFAGIGISILLWVLVDAKYASIGVLVTCIGIGQIIIYRIMNPASQKTENHNPENKHSKPGEE